MMHSDSKLPVLEFFAGGGLARLGLDTRFDCVFANDIDPLKTRVYQDNFGEEHYVQGDIWKLNPDDLPDASLAWASFPCQDLSLAGARKGLNAPRSGAFWGFWRLIEALDKQDRAPQTLALENVCGLISSRGGRDLEALTETIANAGYRVGALVLDAAWFTPQSRPRLFIIAHKGKISAGMEGAPDPAFHPTNLQSAVARMSAQTRMAWTWWKIPTPPKRNTVLADVLDEQPPEDLWRSDEAMAKLRAQMSDTHLARLTQAEASGERHVGAVYRRIRTEKGHRVQRAEVRYDGLAGCLRTPAGGSSKQLLLATDKGATRLRTLSAREAARLMGVDESYILPVKETPALKVVGDGVCVSAVQWLSETLLFKLCVNHAQNQHQVAAE